LRTNTIRIPRRPRAAAAALLLALSLLTAFAGSMVGASKADIPAIRAATLKYKDISAAIADNYVEFYQCTEQPGVGTMGQHFVNLGLVGDPAIEPLRPEVLVYAPKRGGGYRLVAVEYVTFAAGQTVLGQSMNPVGPGNRYGLDPFFAKHAWIWQGNPKGIFADWNPSITCLGNGDNGGG
jgi:hypothetical protein